MPRRNEWREPLVRRLIDESGGQSPEDVIERYADRLRVAAGETTLPIRPHIVASFHGIKRKSASYNFAGRIYAEPSGQLVMDINQEDSDERQHFTEAHELIHPAFPEFALEHRYRLDASMDRYAENREEEYLCDLGAAALLMPSALVTDRYTVRGGLKDVERLSDDAEVSIEAAANRVVALADEPAAMLCLTWSHKPADRQALRKGTDVPKRLRIRYAVTSHMNLYVPKFKSAAEGSVFCEAAQAASAVGATATLPGIEDAGMFRVQAKRYGNEGLERVIAIARPTA
jgi:Zn-dependent peptidase ImmA (M78 family)